MLKFILRVKRATDEFVLRAFISQDTILLYGLMVKFIILNLEFFVGANCSLLCCLQCMEITYKKTKIMGGNMSKESLSELLPCFL
jgi:hypothetical protein